VSGRIGGETARLAARVPVAESGAEGTRTSDSHNLWIDVLRDLLIAACFVWSFNEFAVDEGRAGTDEGDEVWRVHHPPAGRPRPMSGFLGGIACG